MSNRIYCYLALGSNLNAPYLQVKEAIYTLANLEQCRLVKKSSIYRTKPLLPPERPNEQQDDYFNAVVKLAVELTAEELLFATQNIEKHMGRTRDNNRWSSRIIDIDLLMYGNLILETPQLILPHPEMLNRIFVLRPLMEIEPDLILPNKVPIYEQLKSLKEFS